MRTSTHILSGLFAVAIVGVFIAVWLTPARRSPAIEWTPREYAPLESVGATHPVVLDYPRAERSATDTRVLVPPPPRSYVTFRSVTGECPAETPKQSANLGRVRLVRAEDSRDVQEMERKIGRFLQTQEDVRTRVESDPSGLETW